MDGSFQDGTALVKTGAVLLDVILTEENIARFCLSWRILTAIEATAISLLSMNTT